MKNLILFSLFVLISLSVFGQSILGKWKTIDGQTGIEKAIVEIYKQDGKIFGKIIDILESENEDALCEKCEGDEKDQPVIGLVIIKNMLKDGRYYKKGTIFDPEYGKKFKCRLKLTDDSDVLQVRGYIAFLFSTQYWKRINKY